MGAIEELRENRKSALEKREKAWDEVEALRNAAKAESRDLTSEEQERAEALLAEFDESDKYARELRGRIKEEKRQARREKRVADARNRVPKVSPKVEEVREPAVYGEGSPNSYFRDLIYASSGRLWGIEETDAQQRLATWAHQVERGIHLKPKSKQSKLALRQLPEVFRGKNPIDTQRRMKEIRERGAVALEDKSLEVRAGVVETRAGITTGGGATASASGGGGAAFVTPIFFVDEYAPYVEYGRAFADATNKQPLPDYGMEVYMPHVTRKEIVEMQAEGTTVAEQTPEAGYLSGSLKTPAGEVIVSQQLLDRAGPNFSFDRLVFDQLNRDYAPKVDKYVLERVLEEPTTQTWEGSTEKFVLFAKGLAGGFSGQVAKAKGAIRTTEGTVMNPTHLFVHADRWAQIEAFTDENGRPVVNPNYAGVFESLIAGSDSGDTGVEGDTGYKLQGLPVFADQNIPNQGTTTKDQAIVGAMHECYFYEGQIVPRVIPQTYAQNLQVLLQIYAYITAIIRYPKAFVLITGNGFKEIGYTD